jgi:hypothetical protein
LARFDKYDPKSGGFRAPLGFNAVTADLNVAWAVGIDGNGRVVKGTDPIRGILVLTKTKSIGDIVDVMTHGEIVEVGGGAAGTVALALGITVRGVAATGILQAAGGAGTKPVGVTLDGATPATTRLVVRVDPTRINDAA